MKSLCIKTNNKSTLSYLLNELKYIDINSIYFTSKKFKYYTNIIVHYTGTDDLYFIKKISNILSIFVIDELEEGLLKKLIIKDYFYFNNNEQKDILNICFNIISDDFTAFFDKKLNSLFNSFFEYLSQNKSIVLDGFVNFRIKNYLSILDEVVCEAVNSKKKKKEYMEFISLLKLYINSQSNNSDIVHIIYSQSESILLDENKNIITVNKDIFNSKYLSDITFSSNDYTLNALLTLLPKRLYVHLIDNCIDEFINTLKLIFENRISFCTDCNICKIYSHSYKTEKN